MAFYVNKQNPPWMASGFDAERAMTDRNYLIRYRYFFYLFRAWPDWAVYPDEYSRIYRECQRQRRLGRAMEVDHIVPLRSDLVCGLHVPWNLRIIPAAENQLKSNKWWPDGPFEQADMMPDFEPQQLRLI